MLKIPTKSHESNKNKKTHLNCNFQPINIEKLSEQVRSKNVRTMVQAKVCLSVDDRLLDLNQPNTKEIGQARES